MPAVRVVPAFEEAHGRGAWTETHHLRRGINVNIGDEFVLDLDYQPKIAVRASACERNVRRSSTSHSSVAKKLSQSALS